MNEHDESPPTEVLPGSYGHTQILTKPAQRAYNDTPTWRRLALLAAVLLGLWLLRLGAAPLTDVDEGAFAEATREMVADHDWGHTTLNGADRFDKPILVYWLQAASVEVFGLNEFAVRLPSALCAFAWCLALAAFAWRRYGPPVAIAAAGMLATSLGPMLIGRAATADALLNLLLTLATLNLWRHLDTGDAAPRRRAFAWTGLGLLAKGPVALLIPAAAAGLWLVFARDRRRLRRLVDDPVAWAWLVGIAAPWYLYALARHGWAFVDGFLVRHNLARYGGTLEGHAGGIGYYLLLLPLLLLPWTALLWPFLRHCRARWNDPRGLDRFLLCWLGFVLVFFSLSGTKLPHYVLYGFTPLLLLIAQELARVRRPMRLALCATMLAMALLGAASPWIAPALARHGGDALYRSLLASAPAAPWVWGVVPVGALIYALAVWVPDVRDYLTQAQGILLAGLALAASMAVAVLPWWAATLQSPIPQLARTLPVAQLSLLDRQPLVQWKLHQPSIGFYTGQPVPRRDPQQGEWALTRLDRLTADERARYEVVQSVRGYALVRPASAASEPLARLGAARPGRSAPVAAPASAAHE